MLFKLNPKDFKGSLIAFLIVAIVTALSSWLNMNQKDVWKIYHMFLQKFGLELMVPQTDNEMEREARTELNIDNALERVRPEYDRIIQEANRKYQPRYVEEKNDEKMCYTPECKTLAPPMRICAAWVEDCPAAGKIPVVIPQLTHE